MLGHPAGQRGEETPSGRRRRRSVRLGIGSGTNELRWPGDKSRSARCALLIDYRKAKTEEAKPKMDIPGNQRGGGPNQQPYGFMAFGAMSPPPPPPLPPQPQQMAMAANPYGPVFFPPPPHSPPLQHPQQQPQMIAFYPGNPVPYVIPAAPQQHQGQGRRPNSQRVYPAMAFGYPYPQAGQAYPQQQGYPYLQGRAKLRPTCISQLLSLFKGNIYAMVTALLNSGTLCVGMWSMLSAGPVIL